MLEDRRHASRHPMEILTTNHQAKAQKRLYTVNPSTVFRELLFLSKTRGSLLKIRAFFLLNPPPSPPKKRGKLSYCQNLLRFAGGCPSFGGLGRSFGGPGRSPLTGVERRWPMVTWRRISESLVTLLLPAFLVLFLLPPLPLLLPLPPLLPLLLLPPFVGGRFDDFAL